MKDKLTRLSKGITDIEAPAMRIIPELFCEPVYSDRNNGFILELASDNSTSVKGICFADDPRISIEPRAFAGRRVHLSIGVNAAGLDVGDRVDGELVLVTNGGEISVPYEFETVESKQTGLANDFAGRVSRSGENDDTASFDLRRNPLNFEVSTGFGTDNTADEHAALAADKYDSTVYQGTDPSGGSKYAPDIYKNKSDGYIASDMRKAPNGLNADIKARADEPEAASDEGENEEEKLQEEISALIRSQDTSRYAFAMYKDAISRGLNINGLYESYVRAYPKDSDEEMPKEVFIYFSYETDADHGILKKLYRNILQHTDHDSEIYMHYERAMSSFAVTNALKASIDDELAVIYNYMIYPDMIDTRAAAVLPDIFKCCRIELKEGSADYLTVSYEGLDTVVRSDIISGLCFVPVYFKDASFRFYSFEGQPAAHEVTDSVSFDSEMLFDRPDIIRRCFELNPKHEMLLLSAAREIAERGLNSEEETDVVRRAFTELNISPKLRTALIDKLCDFGSPSLWMDELIRDEDFAGASGRRLFKTLCGEPERDTAKALKLIRRMGADKLDMKDVAAIVSESITKGLIKRDDNGAEPYFVSLAKYVFDNHAADKVIERFLANEYEGSSENMYSLMLSLMKHGIDFKELPEKILTVKLFADTKEHIDECFEIYIKKCEYTELMLKAYLTARCADAFLHEEEVGDIVYEALRSYVKAAPDPINLPLIYRLALTSYYADVEKLDAEETELLRRISEDLIAMGLVFRYTKKLRKKIHIPEDICSRFYVQFNASGSDTPKLLTRILPDNSEYRVTDMQRVYKNIYIMSTVLFKGDELQYIIYNNEHEENAAAEGIISVKKYHKQRDAVFASLDTMTKAIEDRDIELLKENMLEYAERTEMIKLLFDLEK